MLAATETITKEEGKEKEEEKEEEKSTAEQLFPSPSVEESETESTTATTTTSQSISDTLHAKFESKLKHLISEKTSNNKNEFIFNNIWLLNQLIIPISGSQNQCGSLRIHYQLCPENELTAYGHIKKGLLKPTDKLTGLTCSEYLSADIDTMNSQDCNCNFRNGSIINRAHIHTLFASNFSGRYSVPLVNCPRNEFESGGLQDALISRTIHFNETQNGDLNDIKIFIDWLTLFIRQQNEINLTPNVILINSFLYSLLFKSNISQTSLKQELIDLCEQNQVYLLFYPVFGEEDLLNRNITSQYKDLWKQTVLRYASKDDPNTHLALVHICVQVARKVLWSNWRSILKETFINLCNKYKNAFTHVESIDELIENHFKPVQKVKNETTTIEENETTTTTTRANDETLTNTNAIVTTTTATTSSSTTQNLPPIPKHTEQELNELTEWINQMSSIGSVCIKYTYLRDLNATYRPKQSSHSKEQLASENKWSELMRKIQNRLIYPNENEYLAKWFDTKRWSQAYYKFVLSEHCISESDSMWTFDLIQFPYLKSVVHPPDNDYMKRPRNYKAKISVIFAFNAAGDYIQPFFVYPNTFKQPTDEETDPNNTTTTTTTTTPNECFSHNGYVTSRTFETWLKTSFIPYLTNKNMINDKNLILLYCAKLAVFDWINLKLCKENKMFPFAITDEKKRPFTLLFQKTARKRLTDLFIESWKKVTTQSGKSYQFKCTSRQEFFNLFTDAFQNCIEETGNNNKNNNVENTMATSPVKQEPVVLSGSQSTSVQDFKNKMSNSFDQCKLWPIKDEYLIEELTTTTATTSNPTTSNNIDMDEDALKENNNLINVEKEVKNDKARKSTRKSAPNKLVLIKEKDPDTSTSTKQNNLRRKSDATKTEVSSESEHEEDDEDEEEEEEEEEEDSEKSKNNDSDFEPENKRRKVMNNSKQSRSKKATVVNISKKNSKKYDNHYKYLINDLISLLLKPANNTTTTTTTNNKQLNAASLKTKLNEKINKCEGPNFLRDLIKTINTDSQLVSTNTNTIQEELNELLCNVYEDKFKNA